MSDAARDVADWLDACCWRCGSDDALTDGRGRLLCRPCRGEVFDEPATDPLAVSRRAHWESHLLERCWRCMAEAVDREDEVGLCGSCLRDLEHEPTPSRKEVNAGVTPAARPRRRRETAGATPRPRRSTA